MVHTVRDDTYSSLSNQPRVISTAHHRFRNAGLPSPLSYRHSKRWLSACTQFLPQMRARNYHSHSRRTRLKSDERTVLYTQTRQLKQIDRPHTANHVAKIYCPVEQPPPSCREWLRLNSPLRECTVLRVCNTSPCIMNALLTLVHPSCYHMLCKLPKLAKRARYAVALEEIRRKIK